jgi:phosphodiesterase/alkaline phosphatase D-like protein
MRMRTILLVLSLALTHAAYSQTNEPSTQLQIVNGPVVENITDSSATVAWSTNIGSGTVVRYGTKPGELDRTKQAPWGGYTHRLTLDGLQPATKYYYIVESSQGQGTGTSARSSVAEFTTRGHAQTPAEPPLKLAITAGPNIEKTTETSAIISWTTNANCSTVVKYGTDPDKLQHQAQQPWGGTAHRVELKGLKPDTMYYYLVQSGEGDAAAGGAKSRVQTFRTPARRP